MSYRLYSAARALCDILCEFKLHDSTASALPRHMQAASANTIVALLYMYAVHVV
jgi:hypothetical protein